MIAMARPMDDQTPRVASYAVEVAAAEVAIAAVRACAVPIGPTDVGRLVRLACERWSRCPALRERTAFATYLRQVLLREQDDGFRALLANLGHSWDVRGSTEREQTVVAGARRQRTSLRTALAAIALTAFGLAFILPQLIGRLERSAERQHLILNAEIDGNGLLQNLTTTRHGRTVSCVAPRIGEIVCPVDP